MEHTIERPIYKNYTRDDLHGLFKEVCDAMRKDDPEWHWKDKISVKITVESDTAEAMIYSLAADYEYAVSFFVGSCHSEVEGRDIYLHSVGYWEVIGT